ncbi:5-oxoprolinase subunit PxpA [Psychromonas sp.]|uniref:5-oxoprolinase subunit PxpA n=1 Tax=Psychromonas sp. TaxID=1884585 RepID=UPI00356A6289
MKLNCDMGEGYGSWEIGMDQDVMPWVNQANIACGFHAGDPDVMVRTIKLAKLHNVQIGAHPGYNDKQGFGRRSIQHSYAQITHLVCYQVAALEALCRLQGTQLEYVKPHGALYSDMMLDVKIFMAIANAITSFGYPLKLMILARPDLQKYQDIANQMGIELILEAFADRAYDDSGHLAHRSQPGAVLSDAELIKSQVKQLLDRQTVNTISGRELQLKVDSICVHGDNHSAILMIKQLHQLLSVA